MPNVSPGHTLSYVFPKADKLIHCYLFFCLHEVVITCKPVFPYCFRTVPHLQPMLPNNGSSKQGPMNNYYILSNCNVCLELAACALFDKNFIRITSSAHACFYQ